MKLAYEANAWGGVMGTPSAVTDLATGFYVTPGELQPTLEAIAAAGFEGVELFDGNLLPFERDATEFRSALESSGLSLTGVYSGGHFIYRDAHDDEFARFERSIALAAASGAHHYVMGGGAIRSSGRRDDDFRVMAELLDRVADRARAAGLVPSYHPHLGSLVETAEHLDALLAESSIELCADVAHLAAGGSDPAAIIHRYAARLAYVHLKDADLTAGGFLPLGAGDVDLIAVVAALRETDYDDWITVELDGYVGDLAAAAATSRAFLVDHGLAD
jgi:inosose dehydratase